MAGVWWIGSQKAAVFWSIGGKAVTWYTMASSFTSVTMPVCYCYITTTANSTTIYYYCSCFQFLLNQLIFFNFPPGYARSTESDLSGDILRYKSLLCDIIEGSMLWKATRKRRLQMLNDVTSKTSLRDCHKPAIDSHPVAGSQTQSCSFFLWSV